MAKKSKRNYTDDFKREAVKLVTEQGYSFAEAARNLGIHVNLLRAWKQKFEDEKNSSPQQQQQQSEIERLREENRRLRMERDILKKATAFFANPKN